VAWAEDLTHDVFVRLLERLPHLTDADDLGGWIHRVTMNTCLTRLRRDGSTWRRVMKTLTGLVQVARDPGGATPEARVGAVQELSAAWEQLCGLPAKERIVFCMRYLDDMPQQEIAAALHLSEGYISKLLQRTRQRLKTRGWEVSHD